MSIPERVTALESWERSWLDLCKVQGGILIMTQFNYLNLSPEYCYLDFLHLLDPSKVVTRIHLPNVGQLAYVQSWSYVPESDLMAIICCQHPCAANHILELDQFLTVQATRVDCCGDNMVTVFLDGVELRKAQPGTYCALVTFLSPDVLVFALRDIFALEVCKLCDASSDAFPSLQTLCLLRLPGLLSGKQIIDLRLSQPSPLSENHPSLPRRSRPLFPFRSHPGDDILAFDVFFRDENGRRIIFIAHRRTLLSLAYPPGSHMSLPIRAWEDWGPRTTHWMELDPLNDSISLAGSRCAIVKYLHLHDHFVLDVCDFNPYRIRAHSARTNNMATTAGITAQTVLSAQACFEKDIVSELPFFSIRKATVGSQVFLDDEWIAEIVVRKFGVFYALRILRAYHRHDQQWDQDVQAWIIEFRTITSPIEPCAR
ncbi:hypothetical protein F5148DRAFT_1151386 [Russula earlei]|uniref:Uncharacterized protein n=1 Tax=Russula earlei TaxID=71964 RepID=A0ACC0U0D7_9AGAM|nr:hypothetical protein F5148DRAFT_1151386 [Russula earlei]